MSTAGTVLIPFCEPALQLSRALPVAYRGLESTVAAPEKKWERQRGLHRSHPQAWSLKIPDQALLVGGFISIINPMSSILAQAAGLGFFLHTVIGIDGNLDAAVLGHILLGVVGNLGLGFAVPLGDEALWSHALTDQEVGH